MIAGNHYNGPLSTAALAPVPAAVTPLHGRLQAVRRRRLILRLRDWLAIGVIAGFAVTLFTVTFFSLLGR